MQGTSPLHAFIFSVVLYITGAFSTKMKSYGKYVMHVNESMGNSIWIPHTTVEWISAIMPRGSINFKRISSLDSFVNFNTSVGFKVDSEINVHFTECSNLERKHNPAERIRTRIKEMYRYARTKTSRLHRCHCQLEIVQTSRFNQHVAQRGVWSLSEPAQNVDEIKNHSPCERFVVNHRGCKGFKWNCPTWFVVNIDSRGNIGRSFERCDSQSHSHNGVICGDIKDYMFSKQPFCPTSKYHILAYI